MIEMENHFKKINWENLAKIFFLFFLITLFFPIRYVFPTASSYATGLYSDFTSISLYLSDIFLFIAFFFILCSNFRKFKKIFSFSLILAILWLFFVLFFNFKTISGLNIWIFAKFIELMVVSYGTTVIIFRDKTTKFKTLFLLIFVCLGTIQSAIGLLQFLNQSSIGLNLIGEQVIGSNLWGVAKVTCSVACQFIGSTTGVAHETAYIRAYGTFPHPNLLSAFLVATIFINLYLLINKLKFESKNALFSNRYSFFTNIWLNLALFINILGLTTTFSRGAYLAFGIGLIIFFISFYLRRSAKAIVRGRWYFPWLNVVVSLMISFLLFHPFLLSRATISDQATVERGVYNQIAVNMIKDKPFFGLGIGETVLHMEQYLPRTNFYESINTPQTTESNPLANTEMVNSKKLVRGDQPKILKPWQIQPIHNYFLLSAAELGIIGALLLIWVFLSHLKFIILNLKSNFNSYYLLLTTLLIIFLVLMLFDHYFYTLQQTQMLLWMILGLIAVEIKSGQQTTQIANVNRQFKNSKPKD